MQNSDQASVHLNGDNASIRVGGGANAINGELQVRNSNNQTTIHLDGQAGDIVLQNADCAEDFELADNVDIIPGNVMVLDAQGKLRPSQQAYDRRVAGIVAGAGTLKPGIILGRRSGSETTVPIALVGRTYCMVDATNTSIEVGDLLTTSSTPGLAMKADDSSRTPGAVIGKALDPLQHGTGLVRVLVALQ
jgi:hypothetical protein